MSDRLPPATGDAAIESALAAMRLRYVETSRGIIATFELIGEQLARAPDSDDLLIPLRRELHRVHGTAGSLGFHEAGRMAGAMEGLVRGWSENPALDRERRSPIVSQFARALHEAITATVDAGVPRTRQLVLLGLPDPVADRLVAEAVHRGFAVERLDEATATSTSPIASPWGVVAMETSADLVATAGYGDAACVLLRDETAAVSFRRAAATNALDVATAPAEVLDLLDRVAGRRGVAGEVVLLVDDDPMMLLMLRALTEREGLSVETADSGVAFREALERVDPALMEAAGDLYANAFTTMRKVTIPLSLPGVVAGTLLTFIPAAGDYINSALLGNRHTTMVGNVIDSRFLKVVDYPTAAVLSVSLMFSILLLVAFYIRRAGTEELV